VETEAQRIICFMCNWAFCRDESELPPDTNVVRVMCVGRLDPALVLEAFAKGVDGVMIIGCKPPDCHFVEGNLEAERAVNVVKKLVALTGLEQERINLLWVSPMEETSLGHYLTEFSERVNKLGPSPVKNKGPESKFMINILAAKNAASDFRLRVLVGRERELTECMNVYSEKIPQEDFDAVLDEIVEAEFIRHKLHFLTRIKPLSVRDLAEATEMKPANVLKHIVNMRRKGMIALDHIEGATPLYKALEAT
jgi:F420-non-reducing hydrogenase iron-sulfur subunit